MAKLVDTNRIYQQLESFLTVRMVLSLLRPENMTADLRYPSDMIEAMAENILGARQVESTRSQFRFM